jgi:hypothetical protein
MKENIPPHPIKDRRMIVQIRDADAASRWVEESIKNASTITNSYGHCKQSPPKKKSNFTAKT